jgi:group I intron endonuclease
MKIVYCLTFPNNKKYIGKTEKSLDVRLRSHRHGAKYIYNRLYNAIRKYGWENIKIEILCECETTAQLNESEKSLIRQNKSDEIEFGYNQRSGGDGGFHSKETKEKISQKNKGDKNGMFGKTSPNKGKKASEELKQKLSDSHIGQIPWNKGTSYLMPNGEEHPNSKISKEIAKKIRNEYYNGMTVKKISEIFQISRSTINGILRNKIWKDIDFEVKKRKNTKKLNSDIAKKIREDFLSGNISRKQLSEVYKVDYNTVVKIILNRLWREDEHQD